MKNRYNDLLIFIIGVTLTLVFGGIVFSLLFGLLFVEQPMEQSPNDAAFIDLVTTLATFLTGSLGGFLAANSIKKEELKEEPQNNNDMPI
jgi:ABC-type transport system involved in multi-copper enzyme maturation permease subunit